MNFAARIIPKISIKWKVESTVQYDDEFPLPQVYQEGNMYFDSAHTWVDSQTSTNTFEFDLEGVAEYTNFTREELLCPKRLAAKVKNLTQSGTNWAIAYPEGMINKLSFYLRCGDGWGWDSNGTSYADKSSEDKSHVKGTPYWRIPSINKVPELLAGINKLGELVTETNFGDSCDAYWIIGCIKPNAIPERKVCAKNRIFNGSQSLSIESQILCEQVVPYSVYICTGDGEQAQLKRSDLEYSDSFLEDWIDYCPIVDYGVPFTGIGMYSNLDGWFSNWGNKPICNILPIYLNPRFGDMWPWLKDNPTAWALENPNTGEYEMSDFYDGSKNHGLKAGGRGYFVDRINWLRKKSAESSFNDGEGESLRVPVWGLFNDWWEVDRGVYQEPDRKFEIFEVLTNESTLSLTYNNSRTGVLYFDYQYADSYTCAPCYEVFGEGDECSVECNTMMCGNFMYECGATFTDDVTGTYTLSENITVTLEKLEINWTL